MSPARRVACHCSLSTPATLRVALTATARPLTRFFPDADRPRAWTGSGAHPYPLVAGRHRDRTANRVRDPFMNTLTASTGLALLAALVVGSGAVRANDRESAIVEKAMEVLEQSTKIPENCI